jgi:hypothetical protein
MTEANANPAVDRRRSRILLVVALSIAGVILILGAVLVQAWHAAWRKMLLVDCQHDLGQLGLRCREYAAEHDGHLPSRWVELNFVGEETNWGRVLVCPQTYRDMGSWEKVDSWASYQLIAGPMILLTPFSRLNP